MNCRTPSSAAARSSQSMTAVHGQKRLRSFRPHRHSITDALNKLPDLKRRNMSCQISSETDVADQSGAIWSEMEGEASAS